MKWSIGTDREHRHSNTNAAIGQVSEKYDMGIENQGMGTTWIRSNIIMYMCYALSLYVYILQIILLSKLSNINNSSTTTATNHHYLSISCT